jgi:hypothetical protein
LKTCKYIETLYCIPKASADIAAAAKAKAAADAAAAKAKEADDKLSSSPGAKVKKQPINMALTPL